MSENAVMPLTDYVAACDAIREKTGSTELIKSGEMPQNINSVFEAGKQNQNDEWWNVFMTGLKNNAWSNKYAFAGPGWTDETFNPNMSLAPIIAEGMFFQNKVVNYKQILERNGITIDFSKTQNCPRLFYYSYIADFPPINLTSVNTSLTYSFAYLQGENITLPLILNDDGSAQFDNTFYNSVGLTNLTITGVIGKNGFNVSSCINLTVDSLMSIINALKDFREYTTITKTFDTGGLSERIDTLTEGTLVEGQEYTWSFYCAEYPGWLVNDINTPPTDTQTTITSIAEQVTVNGNTYIGFKAETNYWADWESTYAVYVYQDGAEIKVHRSYPFSGDIINLSIPGETTEACTVTFGETNLNKLTDSQKAMATEKGWTLV